MRDKLITLVTKTGTTYDASGFPTENTEQKQTVFARVKSVRSSEFYEALQSKIKLEYIFCVDPDDFKLGYYTPQSGATVKPWEVEYENIRYKIIRTYRTDAGEIEISCAEAE